jgi:hypothetical protein
VSIDPRDVLQLSGLLAGDVKESRNHNRLALRAGLRPELEQRLRRHLKPTNKSWRVHRFLAVSVP